MLDIVNLAIATIEKQIIPDPFVRWGIRGLLKERLKMESSFSCEEYQNKFEKFLSQVSSSRIAEETDAANKQHYELPPEFFSLVLGPNRKYSSCYWTPETETLEQAEENALSTTCIHAELRDGMKILDMGCGWGSLSLWIAQKYPGSRITAVSNSSAQKSFIDEQIRIRNLDNIEVITADMNHFDTEEKFDRVVSVEMFEHMRNHEDLMQKISNWLLPEGKLFVHIFCHRKYAYLFEKEGAANWMGRYFFSGGMMPSDHLMLRYQKDLFLENQWRWNGQHYERTCNEWLKNMDDNRELILPILEKTYGSGMEHAWFQRWRLFFMACAELFGYNKGNEWWVSHYLFRNRG